MIRMQFLRTNRRAFMIAASACMTMAASREAPAQEGSMIRLGSHVIISPERDTAFLPSVRGGIQAVDLGNGTTRWAKSEASLPLTLTINRLLSLGPVKRGLDTKSCGIVSLERGSGKTVFNQSVPLPEAAAPSNAAPAGNPFEVVATPAGGDDAIVSFNIETPIAPRGLPPGSERVIPIPRPGGAPPIANAAVAPADARGALRLDAQGKTTPVAPQAVPSARPGVQPAALGPNANNAGNPAATQVRLPSADGRHYMTVQARETNLLNPSLTLKIYDAANGQPVATLQSANAPESYVVAGPQVVLLTPTEPTPIDGGAAGLQVSSKRLRSIDLATGKERWAPIPIRTDLSEARTPP